MKKITFVCLVAVLCGCSAKQQEQTATSFCSLVQPLKSESACWQTDDGMECSLDAIPPARWGLCIEDSSREFTCLKDKEIAHYKDGTGLLWRISAEDCPALAKQLLDGGKDKMELPPIEIRLPQKKEKT